MSRTLRGWSAGVGAGDGSPADLGTMLDRLRATLRQATDFMDPWAQFHDEVSVVEGFMESSEPGQNTRLEAALEAVSQKVLGRRHPPSEGMYLTLKEHRFWHGTCRIGPRSAIFFYDEEADMGLAGVYRHITDTEVDLVRFSLFEMPPGMVPTRDRGQA